MTEAKTELKPPPLEARVLLLCQEPCSAEELKTMYAHFAVRRFDSALEGHKSVRELMTGTEVLIVDIYDKASRLWYSQQTNMLGGITVVYKAPHGRPIIHPEQIKASLTAGTICKYLPSGGVSKMDYLQRLLSDHISNVGWLYKLIACLL